jgi:hypothetical protein
MKRITDGWMPKLRTLKEKEQKNKLFAKVKAGSGLAGKGINGALSVANVVPSSVASRGTSARAAGLLYGDFVDDAAGNRFYQYDMEQAKAGLLKKATLSEINKYSLRKRCTP